MSWIGLRHKRVEPLYPDEWNRVVDALDILYGYQADLRREVDCIEGKIDGYYLEMKRELSGLESRIEQIYEIIRQPESIDAYALRVSTTPIPLSEIDRYVKRIHIKVPTWVLYLVYLGNSVRQEFVLERGDKEVLEVNNPRRVYVRSLGDVTIYVMLEV